MDKTKPDLQIRCVTQNYFIISQPKHMLWMLRRTVSTNWIGYQRLMLKVIEKTKPGLKISMCNQNFIFLFLNQNICCWRTKEPSQ